MARSDAVDDGASHGGSPLAAGSELAGYRIESLLGRGGMGVVYRARDLALDRNVALKLLAPELAEDVRFRERFLRESRLAASLDHPAIVPIYDAGGVAGQLYIAMRLVDGTDLKRLLADEGVLEAQRALALLEQVADALDAAHERGLVHRDVKPSNVLLDERGHCYLADFGLSRRLGEQSSTIGGGRSLGTVDYVAPEQIRGDELDGRADLYSLGCLLYECLAGRPPFTAGSDTAIVFAHLEQPPPPLPGLETVIKKALAKAPDDRYQSGRELIMATRDAISGGVRPRRRQLVAGLALLAVVGAAIAGVLFFHDSHAPRRAASLSPSIRLTPNALNLVDARTHRAVARSGGQAHMQFADAATDVAFSPRSAWLSLGTDDRLLQIDLASKTVKRLIRLPWQPTERIAVGGGLVWLREARNLGTGVVGIDERTGRVVRRFELGGSSVGIAYGYGSLWLVGGAEVDRVDPRNGRVLHRYAAQADWLAAGAGAVYAAGTDGSVWKIDPVGNTITAHLRLHPWLGDLTVGGGSVWVSVVGEDAVYQLSEDDLSEQRAIPAGADPERISEGGGYIWVANGAATTISRLAEQSGARQTFATGTDPTTVQVHDGRVWIAAARGLPPLAPIAGETLRIAASFINLDPVSRVFPMDEQLSSATCSNLLGYPASTGPAGGRLRPELAAAMPKISADGRTYTFRIRRGLRFSPPSEEPVTAATFKYTIERTLSRYAQGWSYAPDIVGAAAYKAGKASHISGITARGAALSIRLTRPAGDFLTRLSMPVFCPVPLSTPLDPQHTHGLIASTGPYYVASVEGQRIVLLRNPDYVGSRPRRAARIVITRGIPAVKAAALVDSGQLDYLPTDFSPLMRPGGPLDRRSGPASAAARAGGQRFFLHLQPMVDEIVFNTRRPLFHDVRLRRAVGYAIDRSALAKANADVPDGRVIPAEVPGYDAGHVYPLFPDVGRARLLEGTASRRRAVILAAYVPQALAGLLRSELASIGIASRIVYWQSSPAGVLSAFRHADLLIGGSLQCGPCDRDPAEFFKSVFAHGLFGSPLALGGWDGRALRRRLERASPLRGPARVEAFTRLDDDFARAAPVLVYGSFQYTEYFSRRIGCKLFTPFSQGVDLGALCLKPS